MAPGRPPLLTTPACPNLLHQDGPRHQQSLRLRLTRYLLVQGPRLFRLYRLLKPMQIPALMGLPNCSGGVVLY